MIAAIIPARLSSTRLPGKPLKDIHGKPLIQWVYEGAADSLVEAVFVATPDEEIVQVVEGFGGRAIKTGKHDTMLDRCSWAVEGLDFPYYVVAQGDEPMIRPDMIGLCIDYNERVTCLNKVMRPDEDVADINAIKCLVDKDGYYISFSRAVIPAHTPEKDGVYEVPFRKQVGTMFFQAETLKMYKFLHRHPIEKSEGIDLLRYIENHHCRIKAIETPRDTQCVDCEADLEKVRRLMA